jgi:hypothetical protein
MTLEITTAAYGADITEIFDAWLRDEHCDEFHTTKRDVAVSAPTFLGYEHSRCLLDTPFLISPERSTVSACEI